MKVYFACSVRSGGDSSRYLDIINTIKATGAEVISEVFAKDAILYGGSPLPDEEIYARDTKMIKEVDAVIADVSHPSLGVGYELAFAEKLKKPILCLFNTDSDKRLSAMVAGNSYNRIAYYTNATLPVDDIDNFLTR